MIIVEHRRNRLSELQAVPPAHGVEIDLRSRGSRLVLHHDPMMPDKDVEDFENWLAHYQHQFLILNIKEEGIEFDALALAAQAGVKSLMLLDQSFPFLIKTIRMQERRTAVRVSEYEPSAMALGLSGQADWIWLDSFTGRYPAIWEINTLRLAGFRFCVVSPELQGRNHLSEIRSIQALFSATGSPPDAVCTKHPSAWR